MKLTKKLTSLSLAAAMVASIGATSVFASESDEYDTISKVTASTYSNDDELLKELTIELRELRADGATEKEMNEYVENRLSKLRYNFGGRLNSMEEELYNSNIAKGILCLGNAAFAVEYTDKNYSGVAYNNNADAFRHTIWNYGMVIDVGYDFAKKWGDAHEIGDTDNPVLEKVMDLYNNNIGLNLGLSNPNTILHSTFVSKSIEKVSNGSCKVISNNQLVASSSIGLK